MVTPKCVLTHAGEAVGQVCDGLYGVLAGLSEWIRQAVESHLDCSSAYQVLDGVSVPLMRRSRGRRQRCFGTEADFGHGGSDQELTTASKCWRRSTAPGS